MNNKTIYSLSFILIAGLQMNNLLMAQSKADDINGLWHNEEKTAKIEVHSNGKTYSCNMKLESKDKL